MKRSYHAKQSSETHGFEKIIVSLGEDAWHGFSEETVWGKKIAPHFYQLQNTPFFANGLAYLDVVSTINENGKILFIDVKEPSRRSTYRVHIKAERSMSLVKPLFDKLMALGCTYESYIEKSWTLFAWDVPASVVDAAYKVLDTGEKQDIWTFDEGHYGGREH